MHLILLVARTAFVEGLANWCLGVGRIPVDLTICIDVGVAILFRAFDEVSCVCARTLSVRATASHELRRTVLDVISAALHLMFITAAAVVRRRAEPGSLAKARNSVNCGILPVAEGLIHLADASASHAATALRTVAAEESVACTVVATGERVHAAVSGISCIRACRVVNVLELCESGVRPRQVRSDSVARGSAREAASGSLHWAGGAQHHICLVSLHAAVVCTDHILQHHQR
mmetsp:Transcript_22046/g.52317  ORF Transcript_22046/g.52317 Transcript_22046/m.52317 type:complete len:232 (-) Transcript_22046:1092-1787(-)